MPVKKSLTIALAGNPNVGKSTIFNNLTGLKQHTGNWTGKTVENARGKCRFEGKEYTIMDLPGTYSIMSGSGEEKAARDYICFGGPDAVIVVADSTALERNLNLLLQIMEITDNVVLCLNLMDEAKNKKIIIDQKRLQEILGIPVIATTATKKKEVSPLLNAAFYVSSTAAWEDVTKTKDSTAGNTSMRHIQSSNGSQQNEHLHSLDSRHRMLYGEDIEKAISLITGEINRLAQGKLNSRFIALKLLSEENAILDSINSHLGINLFDDEVLMLQLKQAKAFLHTQGIKDGPTFVEEVVSSVINTCENIAQSVVTFQNPDYNQRDLKIDRILTSRLFGVPIMLALLGIIFFITIELANFPSRWLASLFSAIEKQLNNLFAFIRAPSFIRAPIMDGIYRTTAWVISVMLPPMAIFFPLFTILEDLGYLPRVAFNLDKPFKKCGCCGKQSLTMCMGFGCNAAAVVGTRIIDSPRERLIAIITNNFVPCNGRFPTLITISGFFIGGIIANSFLSGLVSTLIITLAVVIGILFTLLISFFLSKTLLKGVPSSFSLELPPYRKPQIGKVLTRSLLDRTVKILGRAVTIAAPAGLIIWLLANININSYPLLGYIADFLQPLAHLMGLDGYILTAFILGFPANEIVMPIAIMSYTATGTLTDIKNIELLGALLKENGWTLLTAVNTMLFCLFHFPCATTCLTIKKETKSFKWTLLSVALPTIMGILLCMSVTGVVRLISTLL